MTRDPEEPSRSRWNIVYDVIVFQVKLVLDGVKDIVLGPLSIAAAAIDVLQGNRAPGRYLDRVLRIGARFDAHLDLYNLDPAKALNPAPPDDEPPGR